MRRGRWSRRCCRQGIGANTAIFTVVRAVLLKPLDYRDPDRLMHVSGGSTPAKFEEMKTAARSFTELGAFAVGKENVILSLADGPEALNGARVSANFLSILGVEPVLGRSFSSRGGQAWSKVFLCRIIPVPRTFKRLDLRF